MRDIKEHYINKLHIYISNNSSGIGDFRYDEGFRIREDFISSTLTTKCAGESISGKPLFIERDKEMNDIGYRVRRLTPTECWKLQGFEKSDCEKAASVGISNNQLYKQAGNSICVSVLEALYKSLGEKYEEFRPTN